MKRTRAIFLLPGLALGTLNVVIGCGDDSCKENDSCGPYMPPGDDSGGTASGGSSGSGGSGAISGGGGAPTGGLGGEAGDGGSSAMGGSGGSAGSAGDGGTGGGEPPCDSTASPSEDVCVIDEEYGVFVSPDGDDDAGDGSRANPYATIGKAIEEAAASEKRVYACADGGAFQESVSVDSSADGLEMFGGFACDDWSYSEMAKSRVTSPSTVALRVDNVAGLRVEDFEFEAADAAMAGESSVGALVATSTDVLFRRVRLEAGLGANGADGMRQDFTYPAQATLDGNNASGATGALSKPCTCPGGAVSSGGGGGNGQLGGQDGGNGAPDHDGPGGEGGDSAALGCGLGGAGLNGATAPAGPRSLGASTRGMLTAAGWLASAGADGTHGLPGQGGGGGSSGATGGGGGGGCGGCGGAGGPGGKGGGASIALVSFESTVRVENTELMAADAGQGGDGVQGQVGQTESGFGGLPGGGSACQGGIGGLGGRGGAGGGGAGGISVGILWTGDDEPMRTGGMITVGMAGSSGIGGDPGNNDGIAGVAEQVLEAP
jgi:hypothetical protein